MTADPANSNATGRDGGEAPRSPAAEATPAAASLLTLAAVAARLAVCPRTVRRLIDRGELPHVRVGHAMRVAEPDLAEFIARNRRVVAIFSQPELPEESEV
jgi:excisionase family DNA binding protein